MPLWEQSSAQTLSSPQNVALPDVPALETSWLEAKDPVFARSLKDLREYLSNQQLTIRQLEDQTQQGVVSTTAALTKQTEELDNAQASLSAELTLLVEESDQRREALASQVEKLEAEITLDDGTVLAQVLDERIAQVLASDDGIEALARWRQEVAVSFESQFLSVESSAWQEMEASLEVTRDRIAAQAVLAEGDEHPPLFSFGQ